MYKIDDVLIITDSFDENLYCYVKIVSELGSDKLRLKILHTNDTYWKNVYDHCGTFIDYAHKLKYNRFVRPATSAEKLLYA